MRCLIEHQGGRFRRQVLQAARSGARLGGQKALKQEAVSGQARGAECGDRGTGPRQWNHSVTGVLRVAHQAITGIGDQGCAGIRHQRHHPTTGDAFQYARLRPLAAVLMVSQQRRRDGKMLQQARGVSRILCGDNIRRSKYRQGTRGHISQVADWRGNNI